MEAGLSGSMSRTVGTAAGSALALALLVCCCVFAALAGPALSLHTRTQALHQTMAGYPDTTKTVQVTALGEFSGSLQPIRPGQNLDNVLPQALNDVGSGLRATPLPLAAGDWASLTAKPIRVAAGAAASAQAGAPPQLQVSYRTSFTGFARLVAGTFSGGRVPPGAVGVAATTQTAARFGMHPGSRLTLAAPSGPVTLFVTAIVRPRQAGSTFWRQDATPVKPALEQVNPNSPLFWLGGVIADPDQFGAFQGAFGGTGLALQLEFPLNAGVNADQVHGLYNALNRATAVTPTLTGALAPAADALTVSSPLLPDLALFLGTQAAVETVLLLLFVSLVVVGAAVILLAARMLVARRQGELAILRARGGSLGQVAGLTLRGAVVAAGPGVLIGAGLAVAVVPGGAPRSAGWPLAAIAILAALAGPPVIAVWQHRRPAPAANPALITTAETRSGPARRWRRPVAEVTAIAASVAGLVVLRDQGVPAGGRARTCTSPSCRSWSPSRSSWSCCGSIR